MRSHEPGRGRKRVLLHHRFLNFGGGFDSRWFWRWIYPSSIFRIESRLQCGEVPSLIGYHLSITPMFTTGGDPSWMRWNHFEPCPEPAPRPRLSTSPFAFHLPLPTHLPIHSHCCTPLWGISRAHRQIPYFYSFRDSCVRVSHNRRHGFFRNC